MGVYSRFLLLKLLEWNLTVKRESLILLLFTVYGYLCLHIADSGEITTQKKNKSLEFLTKSLIRIESFGAKEDGNLRK